MCSFHFESPHVIVKKLTRDFGIETSPVKEEHNHSTMTTSGNYFRTS